MPNLKGLVNDPRFRALTPQQQRETLTRIDKRFGDLDDTQLGEFQQRLTVAEAPDGSAPATIPQLSSHKSTGGFLSNLAPSFATNVKAMGSIALPSTWKGISQVMYPEGAPDLGTMLNAGQGVARLGASIGQSFKDKYGSVDRLIDTAYMDPFGLLADASMVLSPASGLKNVGRLGKIASKVGQAADIADVGNLPVRGLLTAGNRSMRALPPAPAPPPQKLLTSGTLTDIPGGYMGPIPPGRNPAALPSPPNRTITPTPPGVRPQAPVPDVPLPSFKQYETPPQSVAGRPYPQADRLDLTNQPPGLGREIAEEAANQSDLARGFRIMDRRGEKGAITPQMMGDIGGGLSRAMDIPGLVIREVPGLLGRAAGKLTPQFVKDLPSSTFGILTGKGPVHIKNLAKGGSRNPDLVRHLKGEAPLDEIPATALSKLDEAEKSAGELRDARWKKIVEDHPEPLDMVGIDKKIQDVLDTGKDRIVRVPPIPEPLPTVGKKAANRSDVARANRDILRQVKEWNANYGSQGMKPGELDMRFSKLDSASEEGVRDMFSTLERWKSNPDQWTVEGLDALAARISKKRFPNDSAATGLRKKIVSIIKEELNSKVPGYQTMNEDYQKFGRFRSRVEGEFSIAPKTRAKYGERTTKNTVESLMNAQNAHNIEGQELLLELDKYGDPSLRHMLTGRTMRDIFPSGLAQRAGSVTSAQRLISHPLQYGMTGAAADALRKASVLLGITSPRLVTQGYRLGHAAKEGVKGAGRVVVPRISSPINYRGIQHTLRKDKDEDD